MIKNLYKEYQHWSAAGSVYIFSDPHFEDADCKLMSEDWVSADEQIEIINKTCHKTDTLIILGDIGNEEYLSKIKANIVLVLGNHDKGATVYEKYSNEVHTGPMFIAPQLLISHEPINGLPFCMNIHGHDHSSWNQDPTGYHINVAANVINYTPINLGKLIKQGLFPMPTIHQLAIDKQKEEKYGRD